MYSLEHIEYLKKKKKEKFIINLCKVMIFIFFLLGWEYLVYKNIINSFLTSSPSNVIQTVWILLKNDNLFLHIWTTLYETLVSFSFATIVGIIIASILWSNRFIAKVLDPYLTILNSLPKISLGPLIIIWIGANTKSIIFIAILISIFTTIISMYNAFKSTDKSKIILLKSFNATKLQIFSKLVFRGNINSLINALKINISLSLIGVIMGELLVSKKGLGYLITYGSQVFNLNLVITSIFILGILSYILYLGVECIEKRIKKRNVN